MSNKTKESKLLCPICKTYTTIQRKKARQNCYVCKETHNFLELNSEYSKEEIEMLINEMPKAERWRI